MLYKFKSKAGADVLMLQAHGDHLLRALGREPATRGIFQQQDLPALLARLDEVMADEERQLEQARRDVEAEGRQPPPAPEILLRQRAWPLRELMRQAQAAGHDIVWGV